MSGQCVRFTATGVPSPQGSTRAFGNRVVQGGTAEGRRKLGDWRTLIGVAAGLEMGGLPVFTDAVVVELEFHLPKPKSIPKFRRWVNKKPDLDKLVRAALDAMSGVVFTDDALVVDLSASKRYALDRAPGVDVLVIVAADVDA